MTDIERMLLTHIFHSKADQKRRAVQDAPVALGDYWAAFNQWERDSMAAIEAGDAKEATAIVLGFKYRPAVDSTYWVWKPGFGLETAHQPGREVSGVTRVRA